MGDAWVAHFPRPLPALGFRKRTKFASIASSRRPKSPGIDATGAMRLVGEPEFVWGCDNGVGRSGFGSRQSFEAARRRSRTGDQILPRVCTRHRNRSITLRRLAERRAVLIRVCHRPIAGQSNRASPGNPPALTARILCCCTGNHRCSHRDRSDHAARQSLMVTEIDRRQLVANHIQFGFVRFFGKPVVIFPDRTKHQPASGDFGVIPSGDDLRSGS